MKILYIGQNWTGSSARSMRDSLAKLPGLQLEKIAEDYHLGRHRIRLVRGMRRVLDPLYRSDMRRKLVSRASSFEPDVLMVYKGGSVDAACVDWARKRGIFTVNVFPDYSPHAYGERLKEAMGRYDLVISTKPFHPAGWSSIYGYANRCLCVPHGYDPTVHYWPDPPTDQDVDVILAASWRPQYEALVTEFAAAMDGTDATVSLAGPGWLEHRSRLPGHWQLSGALYGRAYGEFLRRGRIVVAPVHREVIVDGVRQPGDEDTTRTYEIAAAGCFFVHRRTPFVQTIYDEASEVPMWDDADELADLVKEYLQLDGIRREMAARAHTRAVPAYSIDARAAQVLSCVRESMSA